MGAASNRPPMSSSDCSPASCFFTRHLRLPRGRGAQHPRLPATVRAPEHVPAAHAMPVAARADWVAFVALSVRLRDRAPALLRHPAGAPRRAPCLRVAVALHHRQGGVLRPRLGAAAAGRRRRAGAGWRAWREDRPRLARARPLDRAVLGERALVQGQQFAPGALGVGLVVDRRAVVLRHVGHAPAVLLGEHLHAGLHVGVGEGLAQRVLGPGLLLIVAGRDGDQQARADPRGASGLSVTRPPPWKEAPAPTRPDTAAAVRSTSAPPMQ